MSVKITYCQMAVMILLVLGSALGAGESREMEEHPVCYFWVECADRGPIGSSDFEIHFFEIRDAKELPVPFMELPGPFRYEPLQEIVGPHESVEGFNRVVFECNDFILVWIMRPFMKGYSYVVPKTGREMVGGLARNVEFPVRTFSCFLQGRFADGGIDFSRFLINITLGGVGTFDVANSWFGLEPLDEDFGQAFASWGCGPGFYLVLPIHGPTTLRDGIGLIFDYGFDPKTWIPIPGVQAFCKMNESSLSVDRYVRLTRSCADPYVTIKDYWYIVRQIKIADLDIKKKQLFLKENEIKKEKECVISKKQD